MNIHEAKVVIADWRQEYNTDRPHGSHGGRTPEEVFRNFIPSWTLRVQEDIGVNQGREYFH